MEESNHKLNCIVIDDEPLAIEQMVEYINKVDYLNLNKTYDNAIDAIGYLKKTDLDLVFLDIQMDDLTGIELLESVDINAMVIFTTAYSQYALKGYEFNVIDYLLKPIGYKRFLQAVEKAFTLKYANKKSPNKVDDSFIENESKNDYVFVKTSEGRKKLVYNDILYVEGMREYLKIFTEKDRIISRLNFVEIESFLPDDKFIRVHRSFIVAIEKIERIEKNRIYIKDVIIPIGDIYKKYFFDKLKDSNKLL
jgi:two-component system, LytTR family, response regulator